MAGDDLVRLHVYLARCGVGSRRRCETYIEQGLVRVNGAVVTELGSKVSGTERIEFRGKTVSPVKRSYHIALYKPPGYLCTASDPEGRPLASSLFENEYRERLYHVGRLDMYSEGLIFYTNDGEFARIVTHPSSRIEKEYLVETALPVPEGLCSRMRKEVQDSGMSYHIDDCSLSGPHSVVIRLHEGKNREIRELMRYFELPVRRLTRVRIGIVTVDTIPSRGYRELTPKEIAWFMKRGRAK